MVDKLKKIHERALKRFDNIQSVVKDERDQCLEDRRFGTIAGAQWEGPLGEQFENKPKFEVNKILLSVMRVVNEYRNNRISVDFVDKGNNDDEDAATTCKGLYRADENDSVANEAYDNAFEEAVLGGIGAWRLRACYEDESGGSDEQRIRIEPIYDADSTVFFDLNSKRQDKKDAQFAYVLIPMDIESYKDEFNEDPEDWPKDISQSEFDWQADETVYLAEYYEIEKKKETLHIYVNKLSEEEDRFTDEDLEDGRLEDLEAIGWVKTGERNIERQKVHKYLLSGGKVLEDCGLIAGSEIPIVPVYGKRWIIDGVERAMGHVRLAKDAQRLKNMQLSKLGEISALSTVEKPIVTPEQINGHQLAWENDNIDNYAYLTINPITGPNGEKQSVAPIGYTRAPQIPPALAVLMQVTEMDIKDVLGNQNQGEEIMTNMSGKAYELVQSRLDMQSFIYMSNLAKSMKRSGEIYISMGKDIYVEEGRKMQTLDASGNVGEIELMQTVVDSSGNEVVKNNISESTFDVVAEVGPSSSSKKSATVRAVTGIMGVVGATQDPETMAVLTATAMMNIEGEGTKGLAEFARRKLVSMGVEEPTEDDKERFAQAQQSQGQPNANDQYLVAAAENEKSKAMKNMADVQETLANTDLKKAQEVETYAGIEREDIKTIEEFRASATPRDGKNLI